jgi:hypothetical protein
LRKLASLTLAAVLPALLASGGPAWSAAAPANAPAPPTCTPSGYAPPHYGIFGGNGDNFNTAYEIASPCTPRKIRDAAQAIGMGRNVPLGLKNVTSATFAAEGTYMGQPAKVRVGIDYTIPGIRFAVDGQPIQVLADGAVWHEATPGDGAAAAPAASASELEALIKLTPYGPMWSVIEAEGHARVTDMAGGKARVTGTSPYDKIPVTMVLGTNNMPESVEFTHGGHKYTGQFHDYQDKWDTGLSGSYLVFFPTRMVWTRDGRQIADLTTTDAKANPYVVFPRPAVAVAAR